MANLVIVTKQCYLICQAINYISITELREEDGEMRSLFSGLKKSAKMKKPKNTKDVQKYIDEEKLHRIHIEFIPVSNGAQSSSSSRGSDSTSSVEITVRGRTKCMALFQDMVGQIREQMPDQLFLDKLVDKFFTDNPVTQ